MHDAKVFLHTMSAETFEGGQLSTFIIDRGESAEVRWDMRRNLKLDKFIFISEDKRRRAGLL